MKNKHRAIETEEAQAGFQSAPMIDVETRLASRRASLQHRVRRSGNWVAYDDHVMLMIDAPLC